MGMKLTFYSLASAPMGGPTAVAGTAWSERRTGGIPVRYHADANIIFPTIQ